MFFLVRSAFWLGLVYSSIDWPGEGRLADDIRDAARPAAAQALEASTRKIEKTCVANPAACIEGVARINKLAGDAVDAAKSHPAPPRGLQSLKAPVDTLAPGDLAPSWRGSAKPRTVTASHP